MKDTTRIHLMGKLISLGDIPKELRIRKKEYIFKSIFLKDEFQISEKLGLGWEKHKEFKTKIQMKKKKSHDVYFEDKVWSLFAQLGFKILNKDRFFSLPYDKGNDNLTQQIDVFAKDDETVLLIECKSSNTNKKGDFKKELEAMGLKIEGLMKSVKKLFPGEKLKFKYILATEGYSISSNDLSRLDNIRGVHFDEELVDYYLELNKQIGLASRYQLLGALFFGEEIPEMNNLIPAVRGKMGGHVYYSFSIEPENLLKIGYILHRNKANKNMMPTYQRIIKKARLKGIHEFIDDMQGYFPNSIVVSIDSHGKKVVFDKANTQIKTSVSDVGILHLPKKYRSAFIIDGQHRLYGYADSKYRNTNSIPVVAFINLERTEQVKLFMEINENQKAVPKNLRLTLNSDLLWSSDNQLERLKALTSRIAIFLGEERASALFGKISIGEDKKIITSEAITSALKDGNFLGKATKNRMEELGTFYSGDLDDAYKNLSKYLLNSFNYLQENLPSLWGKEGNILLINKGIYSIIKILSDITDYLIKEKIVSKQFSIKDLSTETTYILDNIIIFYTSLSHEKGEELKKFYGKGGDTKYWRTLQEFLHKKLSNFNPAGLNEYLDREKKEYNEEAFKIIRDIEQYFKKDFKKKLVEEYGEEDWFIDGVPPKIQDAAVTLAHQKKRETKNEEDPWDNIHIIDYRNIALKNWRNLFEKEYTLLEEGRKNGKKEDKTKWMVELNRLRNQNFHSYYVSKEEYEFLKDTSQWVIN